MAWFSSANSFDMYNPRPVPEGEVVKKGSKRWLIVSESIGLPLSSSVMQGEPSDKLISIMIFFVVSPYFRALEQRLSKICFK